ncbi:pyrrolysine--tRNA(Pyl) ligase large subunit [Desulfobacterales bacterium HSG17]|nr:pyrrolysine--tRNA(Pyl) ligase large subunit [Desulfobacterales bacterium HSG17]
MDHEKWTQTQIRRFKQLNIDPVNIDQVNINQVNIDPVNINQGQLSGNSISSNQRNKLFQQLEKKQVKAEKEKLTDLLTHVKKTAIQQLCENIEDELFTNGYTKVSTPTIITQKALEKINISQAHPLSKQVFWLNDKQCLRPMLATNLYSLMQDLSRLNLRPIRFYEIGSCFRKESKGASHCNEFTMLNIVEMGIDEEERNNRLESIAKIIMQAAGIKTYTLEKEDSEVYGSTIDVIAGKEKIEVASGAIGPHPLDSAWGITDTWVGIGFGIERLLMVSKGDSSISRWSRNLTYLDSICLKI